MTFVKNNFTIKAFIIFINEAMKNLLFLFK